MRSLYTVEERVLAILKKNKEARNDDTILFGSREPQSFTI